MNRPAGARLACWLVVLVAAGLVALVAAGGLAGASEDVTLTVAVENPDGEPIAGAGVTVQYDGQTQTAETFSNGETLVDVPAGSDVEVALEHADYVQNIGHQVGVVEETQRVELTMYPPGVATIEVLDEDGAPAEGASVELTRIGQLEPAATGSVAADGTFETGPIEQGEYELSVVDAGYYEETVSVSVGPEVEETVTLQPGTVSVTFEVTDDNFAEPRSLEATVTIERGDRQVATLNTGAGGTGTVALDVNTEYRASVDKEGYQGSVRSVSVGEAPRTVEFSIDRTPALYVEPANELVVVGQSVSVTVTDEYDEPVPNATVLVAGEELVETGPDGTAIVPVETEGEVALTAQSPRADSDPVVVEGVAVDADEDVPSDVAGADELEDERDDEPGDTDDENPGFATVAALVAIGIVATLLAVDRRT